MIVLVFLISLYLGIVSIFLSTGFFGAFLYYCRRSKKLQRMLDESMKAKTKAAPGDVVPESVPPPFSTDA